MQVFHGIDQVTQPPRNCVATIGNFDGCHRGHRQIFHSLIDHARRIGGTPTVITFRPHPQIALRPDSKLELLNTYEEKLDLLEELGLAVVVEEPFSREFSNTSADDFVEQYLIGRLDVQALYLGYDFAFGRERAGSAELVRSLGQASHVEVHEVPPCEWRGSAVSSSRIRQALDAGDVKLAGELLERPFFVRGLVVQGDGRGRKLGVPTANIEFQPRKLPAAGVYITAAKADGRVLQAVTNVGHRPTFDKDVAAMPTVEAHVLDWQGDLYGKHVQLDFLEHLRPERRFSGPDELVAQIHRDIEAARRFFT